MPVLKTASDALSPKHRLFLDEYRKDRNGAAAAKRAGYSAKRANVTAAELLARDDVKAALAEEQAGNAERADVEISEIVSTLATVLRANMLDYVTVGTDGQPYTDFTNLTREQAAVIQEVHVETTQQRLEGGGNPVEVRKVRFKLHDKLAAADKLLRHLGGYAPQKHEHSGKDGGPVELVAILKEIDGSTRGLPPVKGSAG